MDRKWSAGAWGSGRRDWGKQTRGSMEDERGVLKLDCNEVCTTVCFPGAVAHACDLSSCGEEAGRSGTQAILGYKVS